MFVIYWPLAWMELWNEQAANCTTLCWLGLENTPELEMD
jgi:hypothetical protein